MPRRWVIPSHWPIQDRDAYLPLDRFVPYEQNARTHPPQQITLLGGLLTEYGPDQPIVIDEAGIILKGHGRLLAALEAGLTHFTFVQRRGLTDAEKQAMRLADNQVALLSGWDNALIQGEIGSLKLAGYDILQLGFPEAQLRGWGIQIGTDTAQDPEAAPEPPKRPVVRPGDLWVLGGHRILCGDATSRDDVAKLLGAKRPRLMVTDPPYGDDYDPSWRATTRRADGNVLSTGRVSMGAVRNDSRASWLDAWQLFQGDIAYVWHGERQCVGLIAELESTGLLQRNLIVWGKPALVIGRGHYHSQHETCWYVVRDGKTANWQGGRKQSTLWTIANAAGAHGDRDDGKTQHSTQKPVECMRRPIENNASARDYIYDPFSGSGTTIIACEMTGRHALAIEIDPAYVQVAIERWQKFANQEATLDGKPFGEVAAARRRGRARAPDPSVRAPRSGRRLPPARLEPARQP
jgi:DNA modification methylase